jgi:hypothetical protein
VRVYQEKVLDKPLPTLVSGKNCGGDADIRQVLM